MVKLKIKQSHVLVMDNNRTKAVKPLLTEKKKAYEFYTRLYRKFGQAGKID